MCALVMAVIAAEVAGTAVSAQATQPTCTSHLQSCGTYDQFLRISREPRVSTGQAVESPVTA
jgi:hypothetical protein